MSVLVYAESIEGKFKKAAYECVSYGRRVADDMGKDLHVVTIDATEDVSELGKYGASKIHKVSSGGDQTFDSQVYTSAIAQMAEQTSAKLVVLSHSSSGKSLIGRLSVRLKAGTVPGANALPDEEGNLVVEKSVFSGKALATYKIKTDKAIISLMGNAIPPQEFNESTEVIDESFDLGERKVNVKELKTVDGTVPLPEAELVVSAGRGMKGPENWDIIEELADTLGATTACSRPVADSGWRPHHEHVGQTGVAIRPNLYIAIGISGAIQHLAGVNNSNVIVVINKDPEAPFFKAADYGVVGDLFDVVPRLTEALKKAKE